MKKTIFLFILMSISPLLFADGWSNPTKVLQVSPDSDGILYVQFAEMNNPGGCTYGDLMVVNPANPSFKLIYSSLLAAQVANLNVIYYYNTSCLSSRAVFTTVRTLSP